MNVDNMCDRIKILLSESVGLSLIRYFGGGIMPGFGRLELTVYKNRAKLEEREVFLFRLIRELFGFIIELQRMHIRMPQLWRSGLKFRADRRRGILNI